MLSEHNNLSRRQLAHFAGLLMLGSGMSLSGCSLTNVINRQPTLRSGSFYKRIDDIDMYCEISGTGPLLINQTGVWLSSISGEDSHLRPWINELEKHFTVLTFDARGQGKTTLGNGPISYGRLAADTVRLMDMLDIPSAHFFGHSDGGCIQLELLLHFSDRVKTATLVGTSPNHQLYAPSLADAFDRWLEDAVAGNSQFRDLEGTLLSTEVINQTRQLYAKYSPHPEKFDEVMRQQRRCWSTEPNISLKQLSIIDRPVLVVNAGSDPYIPAESMQALAAAIPGAERVDFSELTHDLTPFMADIATSTASFIAKQTRLGSNS